MGIDPRDWKIKDHGKGIPLTVFDVPDKEKEVAQNKGVTPLVQNGIAVVITLVWASSFVADILSAEYSPPAGLHIVFTTVVGSIFGYQLVSGKGEK